MTIRLALDTRSRKDNTHTILIKIVDGRGYRKKISTPMTIEKRFWDAHKERAKNTYDNSRILNKKLDELQVKIRTAIDKYATNQFTRQQVVSYISGKSDFDSVEGYIETVIRNSRSQPTYIDYLNAINSLKKHTGYAEDQKLLFHEVNFNLLSDFRLKSREVGMSPSSYNSYLNKIRAVMLDAYRKGYVFDEFKLDRRLRMPVKRRTIQTATPEQIFRGIEKIDNIYEFQAIGFWILMFALRGMYQGDIVDLSIAHLYPNKNQKRGDRASYILHTRSKTSESANEDLVIRVDEIISDLIFALKYSIIYTHLAKKPQVVANINNLIKIFDYDVKKEYLMHQNTWGNYQKKVKRLTGLPYKTARKTFDTIALELSVPDTVRRVLLGHADPSMLSHYDNTQTERFQKLVEDAHKSVLKDFRVKEMVEVLLSKLDAINAPEWIPRLEEEEELSEEELRRYYREEVGRPKDFQGDRENVELTGIHKFIEETLSNMDKEKRKLVKLDKEFALPWKYLQTS